MLYCAINDFSVELKLAVPYAGRPAKSVVGAGGCSAKYFFLRSSRKAKGMRLPSSAGAITRYVSAAWELRSASAAEDVAPEDGESAM